MKKKLTFLIAIFVLFVTNVYAASNDITLSYDTNAGSGEVKLQIISPAEPTKGILTNIDYDTTKLQFVKCTGAESISVQSDGKRIVIDGINIPVSSTVATCTFSKKAENFGEIKLNNVESSNGDKKTDIQSVKINTNGEMSYYDATTEKTNTTSKDKVSNPKTGVYDLSILLVVIVVGGFVTYKYRKKGKFFKGITLIMIMLIPVSAIAAEINATDTSVNNLRKYLLANGGKTSDKTYDHDNDGYVTINDLVLEIISLNNPKVAFTTGTQAKGNDNVYSKLTRNIKIDSKAKINKIVGCLTNGSVCSEDSTILCSTSGEAGIQRDNCTSAIYEFSDKELDKKLCIHYVTDQGQAFDACDSDQYIVDTVTPVVNKIESSTMTYANYLSFDPYVSLGAKYGISSGETLCTKTESSDFVFDYNCESKGNNGLSVTSKFKITVTPPTKGKKAIFFGDSIAASKFSWAYYEGSHNYFSSITGFGVPNYTIMKPSKLTDSGSILDIVDSNKSASTNYVIIQGGLNDLRMNPKLGTFTPDNFAGGYDTTTYIGAFEMYLYKIKKYWPNAKYGYIFMYQLPEAYKGTVNIPTVEVQREYYSALKPVLEKWGIPYIDFFDGVAPSGEPYVDLITKYINSDNIHINSNGYKLINPIIYDWINRIQ